MNSNEQIKAPISLKDDVYHVLGISPSGAYYDLAEACSSDKINKWSKYKPMVPYTDKPEPLTEEDIQSALCGLSPAALTYLRSSHDDYYPQEVHTKSEILEQVKEWEFVRKPMLSKNNWFRLTDFSNASEPNKYGYNHNAEPTDKNWEDYSIMYSQISEMLTKPTVTIERTGTNTATSFTIADSFYPMYRFAINLDGSYAYIGNANDNMLPLTAAAGGGFIEGEDWRIAYAVCIPYDGLTMDATNEWYLFIGRKPLKDVTDPNVGKQYFHPDMSSNMRAVNLMIANYNQGVTSFDMIPCLVKNAKIKLDSFTQNLQLSHVYLESDSMIYAMPSGAKSVNLKVTKADENIPRIDGLTEIVKYGEYEDAWVLGYVWRGQAGQYGAPIQQAVVASAVELPSGSNWSGVVKIGLQYHLLDTDTGKDQLISHPAGYESGNVVSYEITSASTVSITDSNGEAHSYPGIVISDLAGPGFYFTPDQVVTFKIEIN